MLIVQGFVHVPPESVEAFTAVTIEKARYSVQEAGMMRFDVIQQQDAPTRFVLIEVYRTPEDPARHKTTAHYASWCDTVGPARRNRCAIRCHSSSTMVYIHVTQASTSAIIRHVLRWYGWCLTPSSIPLGGHVVNHELA